jgi:hypothetical protein
MQNLDRLPSDNFGVHIENDEDHRKLLWLLTKIGEKKLRASSKKYENKHDGANIYVSTLLRYYQLKVPSKIYAEQYIPVYGVYVLLLRQYPILKLGFTGRWPNRAFDYVKTSSYDANITSDISRLFDLEKSFFFKTDSKKISMQLEKSAKVIFYDFNEQPPLFQLKNYGCNRSTEWFSSVIYDQLISYFSTFGLSYFDERFTRYPENLLSALNSYKEISC